MVRKRKNRQHVKVNMICLVITNEYFETNIICLIFATINSCISDIPVSRGLSRRFGAVAGSVFSVHVHHTWVVSGILIM